MENNSSRGLCSILNLQFTKSRKLSSARLGIIHITVLQEKGATDMRPDKDPVHNGAGLTKAFAGDVRPEEAFWKADSFSGFSRASIGRVPLALLAHTLVLGSRETPSRL